MHGRHLWNTCCKGGGYHDKYAATNFGALCGNPRRYSRIFSRKIRPEASNTADYDMAFTASSASLHYRGKCVLYKADLYHTGTCPDPVSHNFSLYKNAPDLSVEIRNGCIVCLCCICLY